jgi:hypothetical protein
MIKLLLIISLGLAMLISKSNFFIHLWLFSFEVDSFNSRMWLLTKLEGTYNSLIKISSIWINNIEEVCNITIFHFHCWYRINRLIDLPRHKHLKNRSEFIMEQILWSDPRDIDGWEMSDRGKWRVNLLLVTVVNV